MHRKISEKENERSKDPESHIKRSELRALCERKSCKLLIAESYQFSL